jgi:hypothetical protein
MSRGRIEWPQSRKKLTFDANSATVEDQHVPDASRKDTPASTTSKNE